MQRQTSGYDYTISQVFAEATDRRNFEWFRGNENEPPRRTTTTFGRLTLIRCANWVPPSIFLHCVTRYDNRAS